MMRQMRENTKWIMLVTAIAFVALMVFEWGMDITGRSGSGAGEIGRVNGTPVMYEQYQAAYRNVYEQVSRNQEEPVTAAQNREIEGAAWDEMVNQILIQQELARRGVRVTDDEVREAARFNPPPELRDDPLFQTGDGQFDLQRYQEFLATGADELFLLQLEAYYRDIIPRSKLLRQITSGIYFTDAELWEQYRLQNEKARVSFVAMNPSTRMSGEDVEVTPREVRAYYDGNPDQFELPAEVDVRYVALTKTPLREDTVAARQLAQNLRREILDGTDFAEVAERESSDEQSAANGGDLGTFVRGQMVPKFDSVAFNAPLNQVQEPVQTNSGFHIIEVLSRRGDSVNARHILVPIERTGESEIRLLTLADSLEVLGESMTLDDAANDLGLPVSQQTITDLFPFLAGIGQISDGLDWAFQEASPGEVSPVFEDQQAFYMMQLVSGSPERVQTLDEATPNIEIILRRQKMVDETAVEAQALAEESRAAGSLGALDGRDGLAVQEAGPLSRSEFFPGLGYQNKPVGVAFGLEEGQISDPVANDDNVYLIQLLELIPADSMAWEEEKDLQRAQAVFAVQQQRLQLWIEGLREVADVVDRREQVLQNPQG